MACPYTPRRPVMWGLLSEAVRLRIVIALTILAAWGLDALLGAGNPLKWTALIAFILGVVGVAIANAYWRGIWKRWPWLSRAVFPDLGGTWTGQLISTWIDPTDNSQLEPIAATVEIHQTFFKTAIILQTGESSSVSTRCIMEPLRDVGKYRLWYSYNNDPLAQVQNRSSPHEGVAWLEYDLSKPDQLRGRYFTARRTTGDMDLVREVVQAP